MTYDDRNQPHANFATTRWSLVVSAGQPSDPDSRNALQALCEVYWLPLYAFAKRRIPEPHEAQDMTQAFFAELLEKNYVGSAQAERGRFRAFLLTAFKNFLSKQRDKARAQKRGGGKTLLSLDYQTADSKLSLEPASTLTAEQVFERQWAMALLGRVFERLEDEHAAAGKQLLFQELKGFMIGDHPGQSYADVAQRLNLGESAARKAASRMRQRYRQLLREEIAQTVATRDEIDDEISSLFEILK